MLVRKHLFPSTSRLICVLLMMLSLLGSIFAADSLAQATHSDNGLVQPGLTWSVYAPNNNYSIGGSGSVPSLAMAQQACAAQIPILEEGYSPAQIVNPDVSNTFWDYNGSWGQTTAVEPYNSNSPNLVGWGCYVDLVSVDGTVSPHLGAGLLNFVCPPMFTDSQNSNGSVNDGNYCPNSVQQVAAQPKNTKCNCGKADPVDVGSGNSYQTEIDYSSPLPASGLTIRRTYNSSPTDPDENVMALPTAGSAAMHSFGTRWSQPYEAAVIQISAFTQPVSPTFFAPYSCWQRATNFYVFCSPPPQGVSGAATTASPQMVEVKRGNGEIQYFISTSPGIWSPTNGVGTQLTSAVTYDGSSFSGYVFTDTDSHTETFDGNGILLAITAIGGSTQQLTYSTGTSNDSNTGRYPSNAPVCSHVQGGDGVPMNTLLCVTDQWGRQLQFEHDVAGRIKAVIDPNNQVTNYHYDEPSAGCTDASIPSQIQTCQANNLTSVTYPDGKTKTFFYNEASQIQGNCLNVYNVGNGYGFLLHALTGIIDENGKHMNTWSFNCAGIVTSAALGNDAESYQFNVGTPNNVGLSTTTLTTPLGTTMTYGFSQINGVELNTSINQPAGSGSAAATASSIYDTNGNLKTYTDFNGNITNFTYDTTRNLELTRVDAYGTPQVRTTTTVWSPTYYLPLQKAEPLKLTTYVYFPNGNLQTKTEQATADANGSQGVTVSVTGLPRTWAYTYNSAGQVLTIIGPRTDIVDKTTFTYDSYGNLNTVKNAAGQITTLSNYDMNGHVGQITDPNNLVTTYLYSPRGWLTSQTRGAEVTSYNYDGVGQLVGVTFPNKASLTYTYDTAHRLTNISDNMGNTVNYTLDAMSNRTLEQVNDASGNLNRQISRVVDALNRLQQITGAQ